MFELNIGKVRLYMLYRYFMIFLILDRFLKLNRVVGGKLVSWPMDNI